MAVAIEKSRLVSKIFFGVFWIAAITPFFGQEFLPSVYEKLSSPLFALIDLVLILLGAWVIRSKKDWFILLSLVLITFISTYILNDISILQYVNGMRLYIGFIFMIPIVRYFFAEPERKQRFIEKFDKALYIFLWIQVPCMSYQCFLYGAFDKVGGSLGWMMSGVITTLIYLVSFYLMLRRWNKDKSYFQNLKDNWILVFLLFPSYLNETKVAFVFLAMYFFFLVPIDRKFIKRMVYVVPTIFIVLIGAGYVYLSFVDTKGADIFSKEYLEIYLTGDDELVELVEYIMDNNIEEVDEVDFARGLKFAVLPLILKREPHATAFGYGVGMYKGGTMFEKSKFAKQYNGLLQGTIMQAFLFMIELGWVGLGWYVLFWILNFRVQNKEYRNKQLQLYMLLTIIVISIYSCNFIIVPFYMIFMFLTYYSCHWNENSQEEVISESHERLLPEESAGL